MGLPQNKWHFFTYFSKFCVFIIPNPGHGDVGTCPHQDLAEFNKKSKFNFVSIDSNLKFYWTEFDGKHFEISIVHIFKHFWS